MYCAKCGTQLPDETILCDKCGFGVGVTKTNAATPYLKPYKPGKGFGISSLVLSIFGIIYSAILPLIAILAVLLSLANGFYVSTNKSFEEMMLNSFSGGGVSSLIFTCLVFSGLAFIFVLISRKKGYKNKITKASFIMCIISFAFVAIFAVFMGYAYATSFSEVLQF